MYFTGVWKPQCEVFVSVSCLHRVLIYLGPDRKTNWIWFCWATFAFFERITLGRWRIKWNVGEVHFWLEMLFHYFNKTSFQLRIKKWDFFPLRFWWIYVWCIEDIQTTQFYVCKSPLTQSSPSKQFKDIGFTLEYCK